MRLTRGRKAAISFAALAALAIGGTTAVLAQDDGEQPIPPADAGEVNVDPATERLTESSDVPETISTSGSTYDSSILTKFVPGHAFVANQADGLLEDFLSYENGSCVVARADGGGGSDVEVRAGVELPDGARIKRVIFYGEDSSAAQDIVVRLQRTDFFFGLGIFPGPPPTKENKFDVVNMATSGSSGLQSLASPDNLEELVGSFNPGGGIVFTGTTHRFHALYVRMSTTAGSQHKLCGVEIQYQVPAVAAPTGDVLNVISPIRVYDSRQAAYAPNNVVLGPNQSRVISIKDARDTNGNLVTADVIPTNATAITYNITIASPTGPNFVAVTPGDAASFTASAINFNGTADVANAATVKIAADRTIKVWGGDQAGSMHIIIDVTGYYTSQPAPTFPNMGN